MVSKISKLLDPQAIAFSRESVETEKCASPCVEHTEKIRPQSWLECVHMGRLAKCLPRAISFNSSVAMQPDEPGSDFLPSRLIDK